MSLHRWTSTAAAWFLVASIVQAQTDGTSDPLFRDSTVLDVRISAPISTILAKRSDDEELAGTFEYVDEAGEPQLIDIGVRTRGRFRRQKEICRFPPLRLNFKSSQTKGSLFHKQDKVKLVTHCRDSDNYEQTLLREYIAYRILNEVTDVSFLARLMKITYVDTEQKQENRVRYGFIIEHKDRLGKRIGIDPLDIERIKVSALRREHLNLMSVFHYLIGNTDFSPVAGAEETCCHNHVLLGNEGELAYSVPYDFDQAGLVNAPHAGANPRFKLRSVRQRLYRGRCTNNDQLDATIARFIEKRDAILDLTSKQEGLDKSSAKSMTRYVQKFYDTIESPKLVQRNLVKKCI